MNLQNWFSKGNSRRFHRVDMPVQCFITPKEPIYQRQLFALGIDYYPESQKWAIAKQRMLLEKQMNRLPNENKQLVHQVFYGLMHHFDLFLEAIILASEGKDPRNHSIHWHTLVQSIKSIREIEVLATNSPKTYQYLMLIANKFSPYVAQLVESINRSDVNHFWATLPLPESDFKIDQLSQQLQKPKFHRVPLAQAIIQLNKLLEQYLDVFKNFYNDHFLQDYPKLWPKRQANVSIGGIALQTPKSYALFSKVNVNLYFAQEDMILNFDGSVVKVDQEKDNEMVAINFELPEISTQDELQQLIYQHEVEETLSIKLPF